MNYLPESEIINLKYQLAQQIKASINRAAAAKNSNMPFLDSFMDTLVDEMAEMKIEISKLSLALSGIKNSEKNSLHSVPELESDRATTTGENNGFWTFPVLLDSEYLQHLENFYYPESTQKGNSYIWMGPDNRVSIDLPINLTSPIKIILRNVRFITDEVRQGLEIFVNGDRLQLEFSQQDEGYTISGSWLPLHNSKKDKCTIDIQVERSISVQELHPETSDTRKLCLALSEIEIENNIQEYVNA